MYDKKSILDASLIWVASTFLRILTRPAHDSRARYNFSHRTGPHGGRGSAFLKFSSAVTHSEFPRATITLIATSESPLTSYVWIRHVSFGDWNTSFLLEPAATPTVRSSLQHSLPPFNDRSLHGSACRNRATSAFPGADDGHWQLQ